MKSFFSRTIYTTTELLKIMLEENNQQSDVIADEDVFLTRCSTIFKTKFRYGFRSNSTIDLRKFKRVYEEQYSAIQINDTEIMSSLQKICINYNDILYLPELLLSNDVRDEIIDYVKTVFNSGRSTIQMQALFDDYAEKFSRQLISNPQMLKSYLEWQIGNQYLITETEILINGTSPIDPIDEIRMFLKNQTSPMNISGICKNISHLSSSTIKSILNNNQEFIKNSMSEYIHADVVDMSEVELNKLKLTLRSLIEEYNYISGTELLEIIIKKYPDVIERNKSMTWMGWREYLHYKVGSDFSFIGNIISAVDQQLDMCDVFIQFTQTHETYDITALSKFAENMGSPIYFDYVFEQSIRINKEQFVSRTNVVFAIDSVDKTIDKFCIKEYIPLSKINDYSIFPECGYSWNQFLLEQYVYNYSKKYKLLHRSFTTKFCVGAIVKRSSHINNFDDLILDLVTYSDISLEKNDVLDYLFKEGLIARRAYDGIDSILIKANAKRNAQKES